MDRDDQGTPTPWTVLARLAAANRIRQALGDLDDLVELGEAAAESFLETFFAAAASVALIQGQEYLSLVNVGHTYPEAVRYPVGETYALDLYPDASRELVAGRGYYSSQGVMGSLPESAALLREMDCGSYMGVPLLYDGETVGEVLVTRGHGDPVFDASDLGLAMELTRQLGFRIGPALLIKLKTDPDFWPAASAALDD